MSEFIRTSFADWKGGLSHFGIKGMKWGQRRFQNEDGSLTSLGKERYGEGGTRSALGTKHDLNKLDREQSYAKVRYDYHNNRANKQTAKIKKAAMKAEARGNTKKLQKLKEKQAHVNATHGKKAKDYKKLLDRSRSMTERIISNARKKGMSVHSRDCIRMVNKGRNLAITALSSAAGAGVGMLTGVNIGYGHATYATGKHYRVRNNGLGLRTHRSGRRTNTMHY